MIQWILQIVMEAEPDLARACLDASKVSLKVSPKVIMDARKGLT